ncbi:MAG TPA: hypothetical protein VK203_03805 [Nostocaceae cyanobacterium]|nr:hypothetical protein [Nostocaceae cyanobacterium]
MLKPVLTRKIKLTCMLFTFCISTVIPTVANAEATPIFGDVTINRKFSPDPLTVKGMSGGSIPANEVGVKGETPTGRCNGFVDAKPDHTLVLESKFDYLKVQVESPADTTIIIKGPGGTWCNDDFKGKNPGIVGEWLKGKYEIWVGSYEKGKYLPYTLKITEIK